MPHQQPEHTPTPAARIIHADCLTALRDLPDASVDAVVTDPPYGLSNTTAGQVTETLTRWVSGEREYLPSARGFMGHEWDGFVPPVAVWDECLRVLKPGGHLFAFAGSRTQDLMGLAVRLAGFEIRDSVAWLYGSGFPKSMNVAKAIASGGGRPEDIRRLAMGDEYVPSGRGRVNYDHGGGSAMNGTVGGIELPPAAREWEGWGTALKPAHEPIILARKPLEGTVAANVLEHGTGALNIDGSRIGGPSGRWPANVVLDESQAAELDRQSGDVRGEPGKTLYGAGSTIGAAGLKRHDGPVGARGTVDSGGASRFFYVSKAPRAERPVVDGTAHPTVKPLTLMRWLVRMVTPPGGTVLDPFAGSGTTLEAAVLEGFNAVGIEREADYLPLIHARIARAVEVQERAAEAAAGYLFDLDDSNRP